MFNWTLGFKMYGEVVKSYTDGTAECAFQSDLKITQDYGARGFPTFLVKFKGKELILRGYQSYETFKEVINHLSGGKIQEKPIEGTEGTILDFLRKYGRAAPVELQVSFNLSEPRLDEILSSLIKQNLIIKQSFGNGFLIEMSSSSGVCDPKTGMCMS